MKKIKVCFEGTFNKYSNYLSDYLSMVKIKGLF